MKLDWAAFRSLIEKEFPVELRKREVAVYGVPRGGWFVAMMLRELFSVSVVDSADDATLIVDDLIESGKTRDRFEGVEFWSPIRKQSGSEWVQFPWEDEPQKDHESIITRYLEAIGEDPNREGLRDTPSRVVRSWTELFNGYKESAGDHLGKCFDSTAKEMVICRDIEFYSTCEHHLIPFVGRCHIGYLPNGKVVGLSKLARTVEVYARRLQIQEQLCEQIADALVEYIPAIDGCAVVMESKHFCMCSRGVNKQNSEMITSSLRGKFKTDSDVRKEFLNLIR
jgi:GTP cyclohydrolase I